MHRTSTAGSAVASQPNLRVPGWSPRASQGRSRLCLVILSTQWPFQITAGVGVGGMLRHCLTRLLDFRIREGDERDLAGHDRRVGEPASLTTGSPTAGCAGTGGGRRSKSWPYANEKTPNAS